MDASDWIAIAAALVSVVALAIGLLHRRADIARENAFFVKSQVLAALSSPSGIRSVDALDDRDGKTDRRVVLLRRTANQLDIAGAAELGDQLREVLSHPWGVRTTADSAAAREAFREAATKFLQADHPRHR